jgi:RNA polymerase sigma-70 factor, ECF subfamily
MRIEDIGALYKVSASTISRRLARLRKAILAETRRILRVRLGLDESDLASVMKLVQSDLDLSISRMLKKIS